MAGNGTPSNGHSVPQPRAEWISQRRAQNSDGNFSQMRYARRGVVTEEMEHIARKEKLAPELIREEVARGRMIIPANINHPKLEPMCIGVASLCKINSNIGNSAVTSNIDEELKKLHTSVHYGADTVMDLSTGGNIHEIREAILRHSPVPIGTVPIYEAISRVKRVEDLNAAVMLEVIEEQAEQGVDYMTIHAGVLIQYLPSVSNSVSSVSGKCRPVSSVKMSIAVPARRDGVSDRLILDAEARRKRDRPVNGGANGDNPIFERCLGQRACDRDPRRAFAATRYTHRPAPRGERARMLRIRSSRTSDCRYIGVNLSPEKPFITQK